MTTPDTTEMAEQWEAMQNVDRQLEQGRVGYEVAVERLEGLIEYVDDVYTAGKLSLAAKLLRRMAP